MVLTCLLARDIFGLTSVHAQFNRLNPSIHIQILQTDLHTFHLRIVERICFKV